MICKLSFVSIILTLCISCTNNYSYISNGSPNAPNFGWDITYETIVNSNITEDKWLHGWLHNKDGTSIKIHQTLIGKELSTIKSNNIKRAALFTFPAFHAGEMITYLYYEYNKKLFIRIYVNDKMKWTSSKISLNKFVNILNTFKLWPLNKLQACSDIPEWKFNNSNPMFMGILSIYSNNKSVQMKVPCHYIFNIDENIQPKDDYGIFVFSLAGLAKEI